MRCLKIGPKTNRFDIREIYCTHFQKIVKQKQQVFSLLKLFPMGCEVRLDAHVHTPVYALRREKSKVAFSRAGGYTGCITHDRMESLPPGTSFTLSNQTDELLKASDQAESASGARQYSADLIRVSNLTQGIEFIYEKIRNALEYQEENLWLKNAVLRILKRQFLHLLARESISRDMIEELIRGRYLENNYYPESTVHELDAILEKYRVALEAFETSTTLTENKALVHEEWFLSLAAVEIANFFLQSSLNRAYVNYFWKTMEERLDVAPGLSGSELSEHIYLAAYRNFLQADAAMEEYELFRIKYPQWFSGPDAAREEIGKSLIAVQTELRESLQNPLRKDLDRIMKQRSLLLFLLKDILESEKGLARNLLNNPEALEHKLKALYDERYFAGRKKLQTAAIRALIFIVLTKMVLLLVGEVPYQLWKEKAIDYTVLGLNLLIPPFILVASAMTIKMPGEEQNFLQIVTDFEKMIRPGSGMPPLNTIKQQRRRMTVVDIGLQIMYGINIVFTGWLLSLFFSYFKFTWVDSLIFVLFLSLVSFFAVRLRKTANELAAVEQREHFFTTLVEFILLPIIDIGKWLSRAVSSLNIVAFVFDFLLETPFKLIVKVLEEWFMFMRERKQNL